MKLSDFTGATAPMDVEVNGCVIKCEVKLNAITSRFLQEIQDEKDIAAGAKLVEKSLASWDLTDGDDKVLPTTYETLLDVPTTFIKAYLDQIKELKKSK